MSKISPDEYFLCLGYGSPMPQNYFKNFCNLEISCCLRIVLLWERPQTMWHDHCDWHSNWIEDKVRSSPVKELKLVGNNYYACGNISCLLEEIREVIRLWGIFTQCKFWVYDYTCWNYYSCRKFYCTCVSYYIIQN